MRVAEDNKLRLEDRPIHEWYRFVLSFPPHLVRTYLERFGVNEAHNVLDPFCGTGTTLVECKKQGVPSVGIEANHVAHFASAVKIDWSPDPAGLLDHARDVADTALAMLATDGVAEYSLPLFQEQREITLRSLPADAHAILLENSISPLPLHKTLVLLEAMRVRRDDRYYRHERLALARELTTTIGNLHFGPEVGVGPAKADAPVVSAWLQSVKRMANDIAENQGRKETPSIVHCADSRQLVGRLEPCSLDAVITSPPYPNEKDYTRTTRLEAVILGFIENKAELRALKQDLLRSNTRGVYKGDTDETYIAHHERIQELAETIEARRIELGKTSGFEKLYARVTKLYFGGMARHLIELRSVLRPGARLAYVVGDQASYLRVMIRTGEILADIALDLGYKVESIDLFRTRLATATKEQLREEVVVLCWEG